MKKICFITTVSYTLDTFILDIAKYLYKNGNYDITLICNYDKEFMDNLPEHINYIPVSMERGISIKGIHSTTELYKVFRNEKFDMVQYSTPNASLYASIAAKMSNIPIRLYGQWGIYYSGLAGIKRNIFKLIERIICFNSTYVEPDSYGNLYFSWEEKLYTKDKSGVVYNGSAKGIDLEKFDIKQKESWNNEIRKLYDIDFESKVVGFVGRITKDKGIDELLESMYRVFSKNPNVYLILIGNIEKSEYLNQKLWKWAIDNPNVIFSGSTNMTEKYYAAMDLFVLPSYREGFGMVTIEAEAMGVPVIVTDIPGPTEAMLPNETGIVVKKKNTDELTEAILNLLKNKNIRVAMGNKGYKFVENRFERNNYMESLLKKRDKMLEKV